MDSPKAYGGTDSATARSEAMRPIADVRLPAHIVEEDIPELDDARVQEKAQRYYFRAYGGGYKGHYRGMLTGIIAGATIATGVGLIAATILTGPIGLALGIAGSASFGLITGGFSVAGIMLGLGAYGDAGTVAGARSSSLAEKHARQLVKSNLISKGKGASPEDEFNEPTFEGRYGHHYELPPDRDKGMFYHWKTGLVGTGVGAGLGAAIGYGLPATLTAGILAEIAHIGTAIAGTSIANALGITAASITAATAGIAAAPVIAGAVIIGLLGASFGINRSIFKSVFNVVDGWVKGKPQGLEMRTLENELAQARTPEEREQIMKREKAIYETGLRRQDMIPDLDKKYYDKIFWNTIGGMFNGYAGGSILGMTIGAVIGVSAALLIGPMIGVAAGALVLPMMVGTAAFGGHMGAHTFSAVGANAGAEAMTKALDEEFQHSRVLQAQGKAPVVNKPPVDNGIVNLRTLAICATVGAAIGLVMTGGIFAFGLAPMLFGTEVIGGAAVTHITLGSAAALSAGIGATIGSLYSIKAKVFQGFSNIANNLYDGKLFGTDGTEHAKEHEKVKVPETSMARVGSRGALEDITPDDMAAMNARMPQAQNVSQVGRLGQQASMMQNPLLAQR